MPDPSTDLESALTALAPALSPLVRGELPDTSASGGPGTGSPGTGDSWRAQLDRPLPEHGAGAAETLRLLAGPVTRHGAPFLAPGFSGWIIGAPTAVPVAAGLVTSVAGQQRYLGFSGNVVEAVALRWIAELCGVSADLQGVFSSGGSVANLLGLGAARQRAYERIGADPARDGMAGLPPGRIYASREVHHSLLRAAGVLGLGRSGLRLVPTDGAQRIDVRALRRAVEQDAAAGVVPVAVVGIPGTTNTGALDPLTAVAEVAVEHGTWFHVDGAYGLFGVLDEAVAEAYEGLELADSVAVDMHKWLAVPTGTGATYVRDSAVLGRTFTQEPSDYIEGAFVDPAAAVGSPWDTMGTPYQEWSLELSAAARGIGVWAALHEIGREGMRARVVRHHGLARLMADRVRAEPRLELLHEPALSICCFRVGGAAGDPDDAVDARNQRVLRSLHAEGLHVPSGTVVDGHFALRACFINPRQTEADVHALVDAVLAHDGRTAAA
ncbi:MAG TPA: pyridoxal-dependent decarboxylase [Jiangellales bacterium]|nr:pyridoxal-dependent decarboxylase [Jiangellales bacterium]